jgi:hypothetical protein
MYLQFVYSSTPIAGTDRIDAILARFRELWRQCELDAGLPRVDVGEDGSIVITARLDCSGSDPASDRLSVEPSVQLISILSQLASEYDHDWNVGHQLEPHLGTIAPGLAVQQLQVLTAEVQTSIDVANSLSGLIVDDEFIEPDLPFSPDDPPLSDDQAWDDLLESREPFIRFPEFD